MMITKVQRFLRSLRSLQRVNISLTKGAHGHRSRRIELDSPQTWEFSGFSQNGEDGIVDVLLDHVSSPSRYFIEVGCSDGLENNTTWLAMTRQMSGLWIDGDERSVTRASELFASMNYGLQFMHLFATLDNIGDILVRARRLDPDVFSLDIDGNDFHLVRKLLDIGLRPRIVVVEYNSAFGPDASISVPYVETFRVRQARGDSIYYGCSVSLWRQLFEERGYRFVTVDANGVNAFFVDPGSFAPAFLSGIRGRNFEENYSHTREYGEGWQRQFALIADRPFFTPT